MHAFGYGKSNLITQHDYNRSLFVNYIYEDIRYLLPDKVPEIL